MSDILKDFCVARALQIPEATTAFIDVLIENHGLKLNCDPATLTDSERKALLEHVLIEIEMREKMS